MSRYQIITVNIEAPVEEVAESDDDDVAAGNVDLEVKDDEIDESIGLMFAEKLRLQKEKQRLISLGIDPEAVEVPTAKLTRIT